MEATMLNLAFALIPELAAAGRKASPAETDQGFLGKLIPWAWAQAGEQIRYRRALHQLRQLDDRDLDDIDLARADLPELAWRHARGAEPVVRTGRIPA
jgi:uncharacterized protein YjiS (DUF1127 family)